VVFAVYTQSHSTAPIETAFSHISPHFEGSYFTGKAPPISYSFTPYTAVVDMRNGEVIAKDQSGAYLSVQQIIAAVGEAGD
jgi:hypothetical protein